MTQHTLMKAQIVAAFALVCFGAEVYAGPEWCEVLVAPAQVARDETDGFIGYLGQLVESQIIGTPELFALQEGLESGTLLNPISEASAQIESSLAIHRGGLQEWLASTQIDPSRVLAWVRGRLSERNHVQVRRDETREKTHDTHQKMIFHRVEPGSFKMGENGKFVEVKLTKPFDLMSTSVTQMHWSQVMGNNPSYFKAGDQSIVLMINGNNVKMRPNHPVEQVSWEDVQAFIRKLNELSMADDPLLHQVIPDHKRGDQYRLPTEAEWEFVVKNRGRANGVYSFGDREEDLREYAWFNVSSNGSTHPVGELKPLWVDGKAFHDLHGNVWEWMQDKWNGDLQYDEDPTGPQAGFGRVIRGGAWADCAQDCRSARRSGDSPACLGYGIGFRLARINYE